MFQHLPENLIFEILAYFLPECKLTTQKPHLSGFPWYLGQICSRWRFTFLSSPQFWSTFSINLWAPNPIASPHLQEWSFYRAETIIKICTERSRQYPLTFEFISLLVLGVPLLRVPQSEISFRTRMLEILVSKSAYWKKARLELSSRYLETLYKAKDHLPRLVSLDIRVYNDAVPASFADLFINTPCLSRIYLTNFSAWNLNPTSITTMRISSLGSCKPEKFHQMLQQTKVLEKLQLREPFYPHVQLDNIKPVTLPFLKILISNTVILLPFIQAPALEYLWVEPGLSSIRYNFDLNTRESLQIHATSFFSSIQHLKYMVLISQYCNKETSILIQNAPRVDHLCLIISTPDMLQFPYWSSHHFRQISISLLGGQMNIAPVISEIATWNRSNRAGDVPRANFSRLEKVSLDFPLEEPLENPDIVDLKKHFEEQDIQLALDHGPAPRSIGGMRSRYYLDVFKM